MAPENSNFTVKRDFEEKLIEDISLFRENIAVLGHRKTGKTLLLKKILNNREKDIIPVYIDLNKTSLSPEHFSIELIGNVLFWSSGADVSEYKNFMDIGYLLKKIINKKSSSFLKIIENELLKIKPNQRLVVESAFGFLEDISKEKKLLVLLDNFEDILQLNNFSQIKNILEIINFNNKNIRYCVASSSISLCKKLLKNFKIVEIRNFNENEINELFNLKDRDKINEIFRLTNGNPYLVNVLLNYLKNNEKDIKKIFFNELIVRNSSIYSYCKEILQVSLENARGQTMPRAILKVLANLKEATLTEIANKIYRSAPVTKSIIERLVEVDLISKKDGKYSFENPVLELFVRLTYNGYEFDEVPDDKILKKLEEEL